MEDYIRELCKFCNISFDEIIQQYNSNITTVGCYINCIIKYKIENNKDIIYKEDISKVVSKICSSSQEEFMKNVMRDIKCYDLDINNLTFKDCHSIYLEFYYMSTFLEYEPVDIKIALKD